MNKPSFIITALALVALSIYLFVQAPEPLPEEQVSGETIPIETVFRVIAAENDVARALYTSEIVGQGGAAGLSFSEHWRDEDVEAGPLPALFLRESAASLEKSPVPLGLFLGSDYPIASSNLFSGPQQERFDVIKETLEPQFFLAEDTQLYTAMFPDFASVQPCVACHNGHPDSPKTDWELNDIMGATTWAYPKEAVTMDEFIQIIGAVRQGFADAYTAYIDDAREFSNPPEIGENWPRDGYFLPSPEVFLAEFASRASSHTVNGLVEGLQAAGQPASES